MDAPGQEGSLSVAGGRSLNDSTCIEGVPLQNPHVFRANPYPGGQRSSVMGSAPEMPNVRRRPENNRCPLLPNLLPNSLGRAGIETYGERRRVRFCQSFQVQLGTNRDSGDRI